MLPTPLEALAALQEATARMTARPLAHGMTRTGAVVRIPDDLPVVVIGDLHGQWKNLDVILQHDELAEQVQRGQIVLVILGDVVHSEGTTLEARLAMDSSLITMQKILELMAASPPGHVLYLLGNHDASLHAPTIDRTNLGEVYERAMRGAYGDDYVEAYRQFLGRSPLIVTGQGFVACHAIDQVAADWAAYEQLEAMDVGHPVVQQVIQAGADGQSVGAVERFLREAGQPAATLVTGHHHLHDGAWFLRDPRIPQHLILYAGRDTGHAHLGYARFDGGHLTPVEIMAAGLEEWDRIIRDLLGDAEPARTNAIFALEAKPLDAAVHVLPLLENNSVGARNAAIVLLGKAFAEHQRIRGLEPEFLARAIEALVQQLRNPDVHVRRLAVEALSQSGPQALARMFEATEDPNPQIRHGALRVLRQMETAYGAVEEWLSTPPTDAQWDQVRADLKAAEPQVRAQAIGRWFSYAQRHMFSTGTPVPIRNQEILEVLAAQIPMEHGIALVSFGQGLTPGEFDLIVLVKNKVIGTSFVKSLQSVAESLGFEIDTAVFGEHRLVVTPKELGEAFTPVPNADMPLRLTALMKFQLVQGDRTLFDEAIRGVWGQWPIEDAFEVIADGHSSPHSAKVALRSIQRISWLGQLLLEARGVIIDNPLDIPSGLQGMTRESLIDAKTRDRLLDYYSKGLRSRALHVWDPDPKGQEEIRPEGPLRERLQRQIWGEGGESRAIQTLDEIERAIAAQRDALTLAGLEETREGADSPEVWAQVQLARLLQAWQTVVGLYERELLGTRLAVLAPKDSEVNTVAEIMDATYDVYARAADDGIPMRAEDWIRINQILIERVGARWQARPTDIPAAEVLDLVREAVQAVMPAKTHDQLDRLIIGMTFPGLPVVARYAQEPVVTAVAERRFPASAWLDQANALASKGDIKGAVRGAQMVIYLLRREGLTTTDQKTALDVLQWAETQLSEVAQYQSTRETIRTIADALEQRPIGQLEPQVLDALMDERDALELSVAWDVTRLVHAMGPRKLGTAAIGLSTTAVTSPSGRALLDLMDRLARGERVPESAALVVVVGEGAEASRAQHPSITVVAESSEAAASVLVGRGVGSLPYLATPEETAALTGALDRRNLPIRVNSIPLNNVSLDLLLEIVLKNLVGPEAMAQARVDLRQLAHNLKQLASLGV